MRDFNSSTESFSDCTWPETESSFPLPASLCAAIFCCSAFTVAVIWVALSAVCCARFCKTPNRASSVDCTRCIISSSCCTWVCSSMISDRNRGHLGGIVGGLLCQVLQDAKPRIQRGLHTLHHIQQLLHLGLQLDDFLGSSMCGHGRRGCNNGKDCSREETIAKRKSYLHFSPTKQWTVVSGQLFELGMRLSVFHCFGM